MAKIGALITLTMSLTWREYQRTSEAYNAGGGIRETFNDFYSPHLYRGPKGKRETFKSLVSKVKDTASFGKLSNDQVTVHGQRQLWTPQVRAVYEITRSARGIESARGEKNLPGEKILFTGTNIYVLYHKPNGQDLVRDPVSGRFVSPSKAEGAVSL